MQKMNDGGMGREFWDQREQRFDPQFRSRQGHQRFYPQNAPPDGGHAGEYGLTLFCKHLMPGKKLCLLTW